jgi:heptaprenylglyceryl phosphate synthase
MIASVRKVYEGTLIVGGGITNPEAAKKAAAAGADVIVIGSMLETANFETMLTGICNAISRKNVM